jgi:hypothetical protein
MPARSGRRRSRSVETVPPHVLAGKPDQHRRRVWHFAGRADVLPAADRGCDRVSPEPDLCADHDGDLAVAIVRPAPRVRGAAYPTAVVAVHAGGDRRALPAGRRRGLGRCARCQAQSRRIVDSFAGGGGASTGIEMALGRSPDIAINHDATRWRCTRSTIPATRHLPHDIWKVDPRGGAGPPGRAAVGLAGLQAFLQGQGRQAGREKSATSPGWWCTGPTGQRRASSSWRTSRSSRPGDRSATTAAVPGTQGRSPSSAGSANCDGSATSVEWRELRACDYGAPTIRKRLFLIARRDGEPIVWPQPTHGDPKSDASSQGG